MIGHLVYLSRASNFPFLFFMVPCLRLSTLKFWVKLHYLFEFFVNCCIQIHLACSEYGNWSSHRWTLTSRAGGLMAETQGGEPRGEPSRRVRTCSLALPLCSCGRCACANHSAKQWAHNWRCWELLLNPEGLLALEKPVGLGGTLFFFSESEDVLLAIKEGEESNNCKYFREKYMPPRSMRF